MLNKFVYSDNNKRYHTFDYYLKNKYGKKTFKVSLDANFTCPNRDGSKGIGGCIYCSELGSGEFSGNKTKPLMQQFYEGIESYKKKWKDGLAIAYFQAFTNTYAPLSYLHACYDQFVDCKDCVAIAIATRPDCLNKETLDYLEEISKKKDLYVELGLQSSFDSTGELINRCYSFNDFKEAVKQLNLRKIKVVVHIINGLPGEDKNMMLETIKSISRLPLFGIKFHCLNVLKNTKLANIYEDINLHILTKDEYLDIVSEQIALLPNNIVVERINADPKKSDIIAPTWNISKISISNDLDKILENKNIYQGINYSKDEEYLGLVFKILSQYSQNSLAIFSGLSNDSIISFLKYSYDNLIFEPQKNCDAIVCNYVEKFNINVLNLIDMLNKNGVCVFLSSINNKDNICNYLNNKIKSGFKYTSTSFDNIVIFEIWKL